MQSQQKKFAFVRFPRGLRLAVPNHTVTWLVLVILSGLGACKPTSTGTENGEASASVPTTQSPKSLESLPANATPVALRLYEKSKDCYDCSLANCSELSAQTAQLTGVAAEGPAQGKPKAALALETLKCVLEKQCVTNKASVACYCGTANGVDCVANKADGPCKSLIEAGLETTDPAKVAVNFTKPETGGGMALSLVLCLIENSCNACF